MTNLTPNFSTGMREHRLCFLQKKSLKDDINEGARQAEYIRRAEKKEKDEGPESVSDGLNEREAVHYKKVLKLIKPGFSDTGVLGFVTMSGPRKRRALRNYYKGEADRELAKHGITYSYLGNNSMYYKQNTLFAKRLSDEATDMLLTRKKEIKEMRDTIDYVRQQQNKGPLKISVAPEETYEMKLLRQTSESLQAEAKREGYNLTKADTASLNAEKMLRKMLVSKKIVPAWRISSLMKSIEGQDFLDCELETVLKKSEILKDNEDLQSTLLKAVKTLRGKRRFSSFGRRDRAWYRLGHMLDKNPNTSMKAMREYLNDNETIEGTEIQLRLATGVTKAYVVGRDNGVIELEMVTNQENGSGFSQCFLYPGVQERDTMKLATKPRNPKAEWPEQELDYKSIRISSFT